MVAKLEGRAAVIAGIAIAKQLKGHQRLHDNLSFFQTESARKNCFSYTICHRHNIFTVIFHSL
jgi:hypothetical protein